MDQFALGKLGPADESWDVSLFSFEKIKYLNKLLMLPSVVAVCGWIIKNTHNTLKGANRQLNKDTGIKQGEN